MTASEWAQLKTWFGEAITVDAAARRTVITRVRQQAPALAPELEKLLAAHEDTSYPTRAMMPRLASWPERFPEGVPAGTEIGPYRAVRELGRGGAGLVLLAERSDDEFHRPVALKLLRFRHETGGEEENGLLRERGSLARLQHASIATLFDWGTAADGLHWLATEFVAGQPIDEFCRARHVRAREILRLFSQVAAAVEYAHSRGILHRDLKPGNILVTHEGAVKLLDFGIAHIAGSGDDDGVLHRFTPLYASPEQMDGEAATAASDVYSLGIVLGQLLSASPQPRDRRRSSLDAILAHAIAGAAQQRYASVAAFAQDLERYAQHRPPRGVRLPWPERAVWFSRRHWQSLAVMAAVAVLAVAMVFWATHSQHLPPAFTPPVAALAFAPQSMSETSATLPLQVHWPQGAQVHSVEVVTQGVPNLDFSSADASACLGTFAAGASCHMHVRFSPTAAGGRMGAVVFRDAAGHILSTRYISGREETEQNWTPVRSSRRVISGLRFARGLSTDAAGNAYFVESRGGTMDEWPAGSSRVRILARMPIAGGGTAVDGAGNLYFSSSARHAVYKLVNGTPQLVASAPPRVLLDDNLSVDGAGNLYTSGYNGGIFMIPSGTHNIVQLYPGDRDHRFIAMESDLDGNLFCLDYLRNALYELGAGSSQLRLLVPSDGNLSQPHALALLYDDIMLVGNNVPGGRILRYDWTHKLSTLSVEGALTSIAVFGQSELFAVVNNSQVIAYALRPTQPLRPAP